MGPVRSYMSKKLVSIEDLDRIFNEEGDLLYRYLLVLSGNPHDAGDLLQTVFVKFIEQVKKNRILKKTVSNYLRTMARNVFLDKYRAERKIIFIEKNEFIETDEEKIKIEENSRRINLILIEALSNPEIPEPVIQVLRMRFLKNMNIAAICQTMKKSRSTIYRMMEKGLVYLTRAFEEAGMRVEDLEQ